MNLTLQIHGLLLNPLSKHDALPQLLFMALLKIHPFQMSRWNPFSCTKPSNKALSTLLLSAQVSQHSYSWDFISLPSFLFCLNPKGPSGLTLSLIFFFFFGGILKQKDSTCLALVVKTKMWKWESHFCGKCWPGNGSMLTGEKRYT